MITKGDIKLKKTQVMQDVPEGGGAPTSETIPDGANNAIFPDVSEMDRAGGRFSLRKVVVHVDVPTLDEYLGVNLIVSRPPFDPNVVVSLINTGSLFDQRTDAVNRVEGYLVSGPVWSGYLMNDHYAGQRNIQLFQREGSSPPNIGRTLVLTYLPGTPNQRQQFVRILDRESETREFSYNSGGNPQDYKAQVITCEISDALRFDFPGSEPNRLFVAEAGKTVTRDTSVADSGNYFGIQPLAVAAEIGDVGVKAASVFTQLVPNSRTERTEIDQRPAAVRNVLLQEAPRRVEVPSSPHTDRIKISQENRASSFVRILRPNPAPGTLNISFMALGAWYSLEDNGQGQLTGPGAGTINYTTGSVSVTLNALPDVNSQVIFTWGERVGFTNRAGQAGFRPPEYAFQVADGSLEPGTFKATWTSAGVVRTAVDNGTRALTGDATGHVDYATGTVLLTPTYMIDAGGEFLIDYEVSDKLTETFPGVAPDGAGFALITLAEPPEPKSIAVRWVTKRTATKSSGGTMSTGSTTKDSTTKNTSMTVSAYNANVVSQQVGVGMLANPPANMTPGTGVQGTPAPPGSLNKPAPKVVQIGRYEDDNSPAYGVIYPYQIAENTTWLYPNNSVQQVLPASWRASDPKLNPNLVLATAPAAPTVPPAGATPPVGPITPPENRFSPTLLGTPVTTIDSDGRFKRTYTFSNIVSPGVTTGYVDRVTFGAVQYPSRWKITSRFSGSNYVVVVESLDPLVPATYSWSLEIANRYYLGPNDYDFRKSPWIPETYTKS